MVQCLASSRENRTSALEAERRRTSARPREPVPPKMRIRSPVRSLEVVRTNAFPSTASPDISVTSGSLCTFMPAAYPNVCTMLIASPALKRRCSTDRIDAETPRDLAAKVDVQHGRKRRLDVAAEAVGVEQAASRSIAFDLASDRTQELRIGRELARERLIVFGARGHQLRQSRTA